MCVDIRRREVLKWGAAGTGVVLISGLGCGCAGIRRSDVPLAQDPVSDSPSKLQELLYLASLAPSSHNTQPWRVQLVDGTHMNLSIDPDRYLPVVDSEKRETLISMGAFIENLARAAGEAGWQITVQDVANSPHANPLCAVALVPGTRVQGSLDAIRRRRTIRRGLTGDERTVALCSQLAADKGVLFIPMESSLGGHLGKLASDSFARQTLDDAAQAELADWIRLKNRDAKRERDGLSTETLEITGVGGWFVRTFMNRDSVMGDGFREKGIADTRRMVGEGAGWFVLTSQSDAISDCIAVGRRFEDLALSCVPPCVALHPMSQALEYADTRHALKALLGLQDQPQLLLRAGLVRTWPKPVSLRRNPSEFANAKR